jgi:hypothetical protein
MKLKQSLQLMGAIMEIGKAIKQPLEKSLGDGDGINGEEVLDITLNTIPVIAAKVGAFAAGDTAIYFDLAIAILTIAEELKTLVQTALGDDGKLSSSELADIALAMGPALIMGLERFVREQSGEVK